MSLRPTLALLAALTVTASLTVGATAAQAAPAPRKYANCAALNKVYKHGVGRSSSSRDRTSSGRAGVTTFTVDAKTYALNTKSDRDKDGVACEKA